MSAFSRFNFARSAGVVDSPDAFFSSCELPNENALRKRDFTVLDGSLSATAWSCCTAGLVPSRVDGFGAAGGFAVGGDVFGGSGSVVTGFDSGEGAVGRLLESTFARDEEVAARCSCRPGDGCGELVGLAG